MQKETIRSNDPNYVHTWGLQVPLGQAAAIKQIAKTYYVDAITTDPQIFVPNQFAMIRDWLVKNNLDEPKYPAYQVPFLLITINCRQDTPPMVFYKIAASLSKVWIKRWVACIENFTENGNHPHMHMLVEKASGYADKPKSQIVREMFSTFKSVCESRACIDVKAKTDPTETIQYILGNKFVDASTKCPLVQKDREWRAVLGIPDIFGPWANEIKGGALAEQRSEAEPDSSYSHSHDTDASDFSNDFDPSEGYCPVCEYPRNGCECTSNSSVSEGSYSNSGDDYWSMVQAKASLKEKNN